MDHSSITEIVSWFVDLILHNKDISSRCIAALGLFFFLFLLSQPYIINIVVVIVAGDLVVAVMIT